MPKWLQIVALIVGVFGSAGSVVAAWDIFEKRGLVTQVGLCVALAVLLAILVYAIVRNLKDASRAESLEAQIVTLKDEHDTQLEGLKKEAERRIHNERMAVQADCEKKLNTQWTAANEVYHQRVADLEVSHACRMLADEAWILEALLKGDIQGNDQAHVSQRKDWRFPLAHDLFPDEHDPPRKWDWQHREWFKFQCLFKEHQLRVSKFAPAFGSRVTTMPLPNRTIDNDQLLGILDEHQRLLKGYAALLTAKPFADQSRGTA